MVRAPPPPPALMAPLLLLLLVTAATAAAAAAAVDSNNDDGFHYDISDEQYYSMPTLYELDEYEGCLARGQVYCVGSFDLVPPSATPAASASPAVEPLPARQLYELMQLYSRNWVDRFNHTRIHRGVCLRRRCPQHERASHEHWFAICVNSSIFTEYGLSARLSHTEYCETETRPPPPLSSSERALAALVAALLALAALSTVLDLTLTNHSRKGLSWALSWSVRGCWRELLATPSAADASNLQIFDGVRVICMLCVMIEHVCWLSTLSYTVNPRFIEENRRASDVVLMTNSTLVVQIFFLLSTFLLANKLLAPDRTPAGARPSRLYTFLDTIINRIIRISPTYWVVVWFAASWWERACSGPLWRPMVVAEAQVCRRKWWTHLLYLNNLIYPDDKCLIQTWYLAADMQLYALSLLLVVMMRGRGRGGAVTLLALCLAGSLLALGAIAYMWRMVPTFVMHSPEGIRAAYFGSWSFNVLYQSPLGNVPGALAGLLLAHAHHSAAGHHLPLNHYKWFRYTSVVAFPLSVVWAALSPLLLSSPPSRAAAAALAVLERPVFALGISLSLLGALHGVKSPWGSALSWRGWAPLARLSFSALLLHMPINKTLVASRLHPKQLDRFTAVFEWCGIACISYLAAVPLALLVEIPCQRLHRALRASLRPRAAATAAAAAVTGPTHDNNNNLPEKSQHN